MINIAEILKKAPIGLKLYSTMVGECKLSCVIGDEISIEYIDSSGNPDSLVLDEFGRFSENGDCVLFPTSSDLYNDYKKIIEHYGVRNQLKKLSEEVYELQEAVIEEDLLCGVNGCNNKNITEEIADVFVILRQLVMHFDIAKNDIEDMADYKVKRTLERIKKEVENV